MKIAHPSHRWNLHSGECRQCSVAATSRMATLACLKAPVAKPSPAPKREGPNLHAASLIGARDLLPRND